MPVLENADARIRRLQKLIEADGFNQLAHFELGSEYLREGRYIEAAAKFRRAVELNPEYVAAWRGLGEAYELARVSKEASAAWRTGIDAARRLGDPAAAREMEIMLSHLPQEQLRP